MHRLLQRQASRLYGKRWKLSQLDPVIQDLIQTVSATYEEFDREIRFLNHTIRINSEELNLKHHDTEIALQALAEAQRLSRIGSWQFDLATQTMYWSDELYRIVEQQRGEFTPPHDLIYRWVVAEDRPYYDPNLMENRQLSHFALTYRIELPPNTTKYLHEQRETIYNSENAMVAIRGTVQDITLQKQVEHELEAERSRAESAGKMKAAFLANMSHEIRTPMNAIIGMTYLVLKSELTPWQRNYLSQIQSASKSLLGIINDILDFSKIEAGKLTLTEQPFRLEQVLSDALICQMPRIRDKSIELLLEVADPYLLSADVTLLGDALRLGQVLSNLLSNSVKFTHQGYVLLSVAIDERTDNQLMLHFTIEDTGIGMSHDQVEHLFQEFTQGDSSSTRKYEGTGLGLSISKNLVEMMHGRIWVETAIDIGSIFHFSLPFIQDLHAPKTAAHQPIDSKSLPENLRILIVDDHPQARQVLSRMLQGFGYAHSRRDRLEEAESAAEARALILQAALEEAPYDLLFIDWFMPHESGADLLASLQQADLLRSLRIAIVSAHDLEEIRREANQFGVEHFLVKPVLPQQLGRLLVQWQTGSTLLSPFNTEAFEPMESIQLEGMQILLVEDNEMNQQLALDLLQSYGIQVDVAMNGEQALAQLTRHPPHHYHAILMDLQMPIMDGYEATQQLRSNPIYANLPIIAMSANAMVDQHRRAYDLGINDYIDKPVDPAKLYHTLQRYYHPSSITTTPAPPPPSPTQQLIHFTLPEISGLDATLGFRLANQRPRLYLKTLTYFIDKYQHFETIMLPLLEQQAWSQAHIEAHTLKGLAATIGATALSLRTRELEEHCQKQHPQSQALILELLPLLNPLVKAIQHYLEQQNHTTLEPPSSPPTPLDQATLHQHFTQIRELLERGDSDAVDLWEQQQANLKSTLPELLFNQIHHAIQSYDFNAAAEAIQSFQSPSPESSPAPLPPSPQPNTSPTAPKDPPLWPTLRYTIDQVATPAEIERIDTALRQYDFTTFFNLLTQMSRTSA